MTLSADLALVVVFLAFILLQPPAAHSSLRKKIDDSVSRYIILKSVISFSVAVFVYIVLAAVAFPLGLFVALATFVLNFVPSLGPTISTLLVVPIILLDDLAPYQSVIALTVPFLVHICVGNILEPWLFGQEFSMNPVIILFSLGVWYIVWGTVGAMLAVPLTRLGLGLTKSACSSAIGCLSSCMRAPRRVPWRARGSSSVRHSSALAAIAPHQGSSEWAWTASTRRKVRSGGQ